MATMKGVENRMEEVCASCRYCRAAKLAQV